MTIEEFKSAPSETSKYLDQTVPHCYRADGQPGCGVDIASQGASVVPWAMGFDLPKDEFSAYCGGAAAKGPIQLRGHADKLPFDDDSLDFLHSSHLLEDYLHWGPILQEWVRVIKPGGKLIILVPDKKLWNEAIANGQPPNCSHRHEAFVGELSTYAESLGVEVIKDQLTNCCEGDYSILFVARKL